MNDDQQTPEGVEITDYLGEPVSPQQVRRSASGGKASDASTSLPIRRGSRAITVWAAVGLLCTIVALLLFLSAFVWGFFYTMGLNYETSPLLYQLLFYLPLGLGAMGVVIGIVTLVLRRRASKPELVAALSTISLSITGIALFLIAMALVAISNVSL